MFDQPRFVLDGSSQRSKVENKFTFEKKLLRVLSLNSASNEKKGKKPFFSFFFSFFIIKKSFFDE